MSPAAAAAFPGTSGMPKEAAQSLYGLLSMVFNNRLSHFLWRSLDSPGGPTMARNTFTIRFL